jgi:hypothetical protein
MSGRTSVDLKNWWANADGGDGTGRALVRRWTAYPDVCAGLSGGRISAQRFARGLVGFEIKGFATGAKS